MREGPLYVQTSELTCLPTPQPNSGVIHVGEPLFRESDKRKVLGDVLLLLGPLPRDAFEGAKFYKDFFDEDHRLRPSHYNHNGLAVPKPRPVSPGIGGRGMGIGVGAAADGGPSHTGAANDSTSPYDR